MRYKVGLHRHTTEFDERMSVDTKEKQKSNPFLSKKRGFIPSLVCIVLVICYWIKSFTSICERKVFVSTKMRRINDDSKRLHPMDQKQSRA